MIKAATIQQPSLNQDEILMQDMKPLSIGVIISERYKGEIVMRSSDRGKFEVFSLSDPFPDGCWTGRNNDHLRRL